MLEISTYFFILAKNLLNPYFNTSSMNALFGLLAFFYVFFFFVYWIGRFLKTVPTILKYLFIAAAMVVLLPVALIKSLPLYFRKDGKYYKYQWVIWFNIIVFILLIIAVCLPGTPK